jgi:hypothetical protein
MSDPIYRVVNSKPKPPWPESQQSYPLDVTVSLVPGCDPGEYRDQEHYKIYKITARFERPTGHVATETSRRASLYHAKARARDIVRAYSPGGRHAKRSVA